MLMKKRLYHIYLDKRYFLIRVSFALLAFLLTSYFAQSFSKLYVYESPKITIETKKLKAEVFFLFEQTLFESGFKVYRHKVIGKNRYLYEITLRYKNIDSDGELILFHDIDNDNYVLERVLFESGTHGIEELGDKIVADLIINPFKAKISD
jgi:hypothetical protein